MTTRTTRPPTARRLPAPAGFARLWLVAWLAIAAGLIGRTLWLAGDDRSVAVASSSSSVDEGLLEEGLLNGVSYRPAERLRRTFKPIEELRVGERVLADNPDEASPAQTAVDPSTWRLLTLYAEETWPDGTLDTIHIQTLQPPAWVELFGASVGAEVPPPLDLVEMGLSEDLLTEVLKNEPCPPLQPPLAGDDPGRLVLTTVNHLNPDVWELTCEPIRGPPSASTDGLPAEQTLRPTGFHKFYSETRSDWVSTNELEPGEVIRGRGGPLRVTRAWPQPGFERVYNLTVEGEHVYYVSELGLLAHNTCKIERFGSLDEAQRSVDINGLHVDPTINGKFKNVAQPGVVNVKRLRRTRKGKSDFSHRITFELEDGAIEFLRKHAIEPEGHPGAFQIPAGLVDKFNREFVKRVTQESL